MSKQRWYSKHYCLAPKLASFSLQETEIKGEKKKKGSRSFSVSPEITVEGNYSRRQNVIRFPSEAEVREGTARQSCLGEKVLQTSSLGQAFLPPGPALSLLKI